MTPSYSPLRYPGGKTKLAPYLAAVFRANRLIDSVYAEPYAGGAGAGLHLLFRGYASRLQLNDIDRGVVSFWRAILTHAERFARAIERVTLSVKEWDRQKLILQNERMGFDLGFAFFYLNRTNRSGIMNGGIIGGRNQTGEYRIDARFNRSVLASRVRSIGSMRRSISVTHLDALDFIDLLAADRSARRLLYLDPPYYVKGRELYTSFYSHSDHAAIAERLRTLQQPWMMTYDDCKEIRELYEFSTLLDSELSYSAREVRRGREVVMFGGGLKPPSMTAGVPLRRGFAIIDAPTSSTAGTRVALETSRYRRAG